MDQHIFDTVTLLVTHYNRSLSLERLLQGFKDRGITFGDIVVSDDGSRTEHQEKLRELQSEFIFRLITTPVNRGLGHNINKGQDAVQTPYTLYVQEDFEPTAAFAEHFTDALRFMEEDKTLDLARMYAYFKYPYSKKYNKGFSEMKFSASVLQGNHLKFYMYSDHPHLRRSHFLQKFGRYPEGIKGDITEYRMALSFIQNKGRGIFYDDYKHLFLQKNSPDEPSTMGRAAWRESKNVFVLAARAVYLKFKLLKWTSDVLLKKMNK